MSTLALSDFRSHARARLELGRGTVAIWGANGAGKTNLLEAVSFLSPGRGLRGATAAEVARRGGSGGWRIAALFQTPEAVREVETGALPGEPRSVRLDGKAAIQTDLAHLVPVLWVVPAMDRLWTEGAEGRRRFLDRAAMSLIPDHAEAALAYDKALRERNRLLREGARDPHWYAALEARMASAGARLAENRATTLTALAAAQDRAETGFPAADLAIVYPEGAAPDTEAALAAALEGGRRADMAAGRTLTGPHRADLEAVWAAKGVPARDCSTGEQKALLLSLVLANARALAARGRPPLLLLDEVAAHLDAHRRAALYAELDALGLQAFLTGTEPGLFAGLGASVQCWEATEAGGVTTLAETAAP
nr:DNA replication/repair protein RecF [Rubellimicrobium sp. CFH 75288]